MGTVVSRNEEREEGSCPSAVVAVKAKIRQDLLKVHLKSINTERDGKIQREDNPTKEWIPEWFPPGIHCSCHSGEEGPMDQQMEWMKHKNLTSKDLHQAMYNMSRYCFMEEVKRDGRDHYMRLVQVTPVHPSELNIQRVVLSEATRLQTVSSFEDFRNTNAVTTIRKTESGSEVRKGAVLLNTSSSHPGMTYPDSVDIKHTSTKEESQSSIGIEPNREIISSCSRSGRATYNEDEGKIESGSSTEIVDQPEPLPSAQNIYKENDNKGENRIMEAARSVENITGSSGMRSKGRGVEETKSTENLSDSGSVTLNASGNYSYTQQKEEPQITKEGLEILNKNDIGENESGLPKSTMDVEDNSNTAGPESIEDVHGVPTGTHSIICANSESTMYKKETHSNAAAVEFTKKKNHSTLSKIKGQNTTKVGPEKTPSIVASKTFQFTSKEFSLNQNRARVKVFPFAIMAQKPHYENPTQYRISFEKDLARRNKKPNGSSTSSPHIKTRENVRGLHGWNLPSHLIKRRMETLEHYRQNALSFTKYNPRDKQDSITGLIEKYQKTRTSPKTPAGENKSPTILIESEKREQVELKVHKLEKLKNYGETTVTRRPQQKETCSRKEYEMKLWLNHVRHQEQQMMLLRQAEDRSQRPSTLQYCHITPNGEEQVFEGYYDSQGQPMSGGCAQYCPTVSGSAVEMEGTPIGWITGKGCGEWKPFPTSKKCSNEEPQKLEEALHSSKEASVKHEKVDSLVQLLYDEVTDGAEEKPNMNEGDDIMAEPVSDKPVVTTKKPLQGIASTVNVVMAATKMAKKRKKEETESILLKELDDNAIRKASEFRGGVIRQLTNLTDAIQMEYHRFISDVDYTTYYAARQLEAIQSGDTPPKTVLLISSTVPKCEQLKAAVLPGVLVHIYDHHSDSLEDLLAAVSLMLKNCKEGVKAKYIGIVCKGGPGHFYIIKNVPVTTARIRSNAELLEFWQSMGNQMSKLVPDQSVIHLMESNVAGNKKGEQLLEDLMSALMAHRIRVESPLELAHSGRRMLELYFNLQAHKEWKEQRYKN